MNCPNCDTEVPENIPRKGDLVFTCQCGQDITGPELRGEVVAKKKRGKNA